MRFFDYKGDKKTAQRNKSLCVPLRPFVVNIFPPKTGEPKYPNTLPVDTCCYERRLKYAFLPYSASGCPLERVDVWMGVPRARSGRRLIGSFHQYGLSVYGDWRW
jgi:hypothetical protein